MNIAKVDIFGNAKKVNAEIMMSNSEESIVMSGFRIGFKETLVFFVAFCKDTE